MSWLYPRSTLQIEPTRRCNLNCKICIRQDLNETTGFLSLKDFRMILNSWHFQRVALHGWGEPLLNPQLFEMVRHAESRGVTTELTTNATLLHANIKKIFTSGLSSIVFGIHNKENLPVVMPQIKELLAQRDSENLRKPKAYVDIVIYRGNKDEIVELVESAGRLNAEAVVLHRVFNNYRTELEIGYISIQEEKDLFVKVNKLARKLNVNLYLPPRPSIPCSAVKYTVFVTSEGKVTPCPYLAESWVGDALNGGVGGVIYSQRYRDFVRNMKEHPVCNRCPLGSTSSNFYT